jgi:hypothetical protein
MNTDTAVPRLGLILSILVIGILLKIAFFYYMLVYQSGFALAIIETVFVLAVLGIFLWYRGRAGREDHKSSAS